MQKPNPKMGVNHHSGAKPKGKTVGPQPKPAPKPPAKPRGGSTRIPKGGY